jgi:predicted NBD/HSP70 family sugar kinase
MARNCSTMEAIGIDIGGTAVKLSAVDGAGGTLWTARSRPYDRPTTEQLVTAIRQAAGQHLPPVDALAQAAVGLCVPGIMEEGGTEVRQSVNVPGLNGVRLDELVATAFGARAARIAVATDARATAYDLFTARHLNGRLFLLAIGTGVGAAVLDDGRALSVDGDSPGHFGQMDVSIEGHSVMGPDGGTGSLEGYLRGPALARRYGDDPDSWPDRIRVEDPPMRALVRAVRIAHALFRPHHIYLAGGVGIRLGRLLPALRVAVAHHLTNIARPGWTIAVGDSDFHAAQGAAKLALAARGSAHHTD